MRRTHHPLRAGVEPRQQLAAIPIEHVRVLAE
jgi:hypothetical protein